MARQLSMAGFTVVVLEQGGWGKYGKEHEYSKDAYLNENGGLDYQLRSDPVRQPNRFRRTDAEQRAVRQRAMAVILSATGTESARRLLLLGNTVSANALFEHELNDYKGLVTGGRNHPTMMIQALAFRAAEHIAKAAKGGTLAQL